MSESHQKVTVSLQACTENVEISPKSDSYFTSVYRKCRNLPKHSEVLRLCFWGRWVSWCVRDRNCLVEQYKSGAIVIILLMNNYFRKKVSKKLNLTTYPLVQMRYRSVALSSRLIAVRLSLRGKSTGLSTWASSRSELLSCATLWARKQVVALVIPISHSHIK